MLNQPTSSPMMTRMLGFFCATAGAAAIAASASKVVAGQLTRFQNFIYHSLRYTLVLFSSTQVPLRFPRMQVVSARLYFLEILESCCALMVFMHWVVPTKVVLNTKRWPKEQGDCRSAAGNFAFSLESQ